MKIDMNRKYILVAAMIAFSGATLCAETITSGEWQYDGATIVKYLGNETSVTVPASIDGQAITSVGEFAFMESPNVLNITLSEGITTLEDYSLMGINRLRSLTLPKSLKTVGTATRNTTIVDNIYVFSLDSWLGIEYTGITVLANASNLYIIKGAQPQVSEAVTKYTFNESCPLKKGAFSGIKNLTSADLKGCTEITTGAFSNCTNLSDVVYSDNLVSIGEGAFTGTALKSVIFPESLQTIGSQAYSDCKGIQQIWMGRNLTSIGDGAFSAIADNVPITAAGTTPATGGAKAFPKKIKSSNDLFVPEESVDAYKTAWGFSNVEGCPATDSEWIVSSGFITAYTGTSNNVSIPQYIGVDYIHGFTSDVFKENTNIQSVVFPEEMETIPENAFNGCSSLSSVIFSGNLKSVPASAFEGCSSLLSVSLPESVCSIGEYAFANSGLQEFSVPESLVTIEGYAFEDCAIGRVDCGSLAQWMKIDFTNPYANPGYKGSRMFINGVELKTLDTYAATINRYVFYGNLSLERVILNEAAAVGKDAFKGCENLIFIGFSSNLIEIDRGAFHGSGTGQSLAFGDNIWNIGEFAFSKGDCEDNLKTLYLGSELYRIEPWAFEGHEEITDIYISRNTPPYLCSSRASEMDYDSTVFDDKVKENAKLHVPDGCEADYAEKWGFKNVTGNSKGMLTVKIPEGGNLSLLNPAKGMRLRITPEDNDWEISSATLGETDITGAIDSNGYYTLPNIEGDMTLNVVFKKKENTGVNNIVGEKSSVKISISGDTVIVSGATPESEVRVYKTDGQLVKTSRSHNFQLVANGVMILTVDGQSFKFVK